jgi:uncharacterized protein (UPF0332 family)
MGVMSKYPIEIKSNLEQTLANLQAAKELLEAGQYDAAASRAAEAAFHTGATLLLDEEIEPGKHGDIITLLQEIFVNGRRLTKEQGANLSWLFALRNAENRETSMRVTSEEAHRAVDVATSFFEAAKVILEG